MVTPFMISLPGSVLTDVNTCFPFMRSPRFPAGLVFWRQADSCKNTAGGSPRGFRGKVRGYLSSFRLRSFAAGGFPVLCPAGGALSCSHGAYILHRLGGSVLGGLVVKVPVVCMLGPHESPFLKCGETIRDGSFWTLTRGCAAYVDNFPPDVIACGGGGDRLPTASSIAILESLRAARASGEPRLKLVEKTAGPHHLRLGLQVPGVLPFVTLDRPQLERIQPNRLPQRRDGLLAVASADERLPQPHPVSGGVGVEDDRLSEGGSGFGVAPFGLPQAAEGGPRVGLPGIQACGPLVEVGRLLPPCPPRSHRRIDAAQVEIGQEIAAVRWDDSVERIGGHRGAEEAYRLRVPPGLHLRGRLRVQARGLFDRGKERRQFDKDDQQGERE